jgi:hypothetical protein
MNTNPFYSLARSRKFLLAIFALVQAIVLHYANVPPEIWQTVAALVGVVIAGIALEDAAEKHGGSE